MKYIYVISDGTGETALRFVRAFLVHFPKSDVVLRRFGNVNSAKTNEILKKAFFEKIKAIEYTVMHDDNKSAKDLDKADIILIGLSRTSKTPLSIYLSQEGYKVANFAIVKDEKLPDALNRVNQDKIFFLSISPQRLFEIRQERAKKLGVKSYAQISKIYEEIEYAENLYKKHPSWKKIDVTKKSIEEAASEIIEYLSKKIWFLNGFII